MISRYRSINTESAAYKSKLANLVGPAALLKALGFAKSEDDGKLKVDERAMNLSLFQSTMLKLELAEMRFRKMNP